MPDQLPTPCTEPVKTTRSAELSEIREADAPPDTAAIYAEMRSVMGIPVVNLIYRHLATMPGALEWVWAVVRQLYTRGGGWAAVERISGSLQVPLLRPIDQATLSAAGVSREELDQATNLAEVYNRGNLLNLVGLTTVYKILERAPQPSRAEIPLLELRAVLRPLKAVPSIPKITALDPTTAGTVWFLASLHPMAGDSIIPSLYLHLATCPHFVALMPERLQPLFQTGALPEARERLRRSVSAESDKLIQDLIVDAPPPPEFRALIRRALDTFTNGLIPEMALVGLAIRAALPDPVMAAGVASVRT